MKSRDPEDFPLSQGAYFAEEEATEEYFAFDRPFEPDVSNQYNDDWTYAYAEHEKTTCSQFIAGSSTIYSGKVSGMIGLFCSRHMFALPGGCVDLQKGER